LIANACARKLGKKSAIQAHGTDADVHAKKLLLGAIIRNIIQQSDLFLAVNNRYKKQFSKIAKKTAVVKNCVSVPGLPTKADLRKKLSMKKFSVVFAGNLHPPE